MASLDSLPPDQRAVLQLVLQRGRSYDDIAAMLSIDRGSVRQRALAAFDLLGPETQVGPERRHLLTDYLLGQLPPRVAQETRDRLAGAPGERAWVRVLASELAPIAASPLPEIPAGNGATPAGAAPAKPAPAQAATGGPGPSATDEATAAGAGAEGTPDRGPGRESSRFGGAVLLGIAGLIAIVVVAVILASGGTPKKTSSTRTTPAGTSSTGTTTTPTRVVAQINLSSPSGAKTPAGVAQVVKQASATGIIIVASGVAPNTKHDAYAVWLSKPGGQSKILGFVNPGVGTTGRLQTAGGLPTNASSFTQLLVTRETQANPKTPGTIVLQGPLKLG